MQQLKAEGPLGTFHTSRLPKLSHQVFLLLGFQSEVWRAGLQRGVLGEGEPQVGAAESGHQEISPVADHGAGEPKKICSHRGR